MRTTGIFTTHNYPIFFDKYGEPIYIIPFGDVHKSSPMHCRDRWKEFLDWAKTKKRAYFIGMGDYDDLASTSERELLTNKKLHESSFKTLEQLYLDNTKKFARDIEFMRGRLIGLLGGNHYGEFQNGTNTDQKLCELLGCRYLGSNSFIRLQFQQNNKHQTRMAVDIFAHHGRGGGRTAGGSMNPVQQMGKIAEADIYLMGDNHQRGVIHESKLRLTQGCGKLKLVQRKILLARTGSFLKGYEENEASYIVDAGLPPTDLGVVKIELTPRRERTHNDGVDNEDYRIDIHASI
jgi:hypothetical protein